jgi:hypothetical protein
MMCLLSPGKLSIFGIHSDDHKYLFCGVVFFLFEECMLSPAFIGQIDLSKTLWSGKAVSCSLGLEYVLNSYIKLYLLP